MKKISKVKYERRESTINKYYVVVGSICMVLLAALLIVSISRNAKQYLVENGTLEYTEIVTGYIVKNEECIRKDQSKVLVPIIADGSKIAKGNIIATYKGEEYKDYEKTLAEMDKQILEKMQDLPVVYSSEIDAIEDTIHLYVKDSIGETVYNKMQDYKQKINSNINKRANIIGELSPDGAEIKKLVKERNEYEANAKKSNDNILAPMPGIVCYTADGLEDDLKVNNIKNLSYNNIKKVIDENKESDNTNIKVVNNYEAYVVLKASLDNLEYMAEGYDYRLKLIEQDNYELLGNIERIIKTEDGVEVYFRISNGIEHIVNLREVELEVVWGYAEGLIVPTEALNKYENIDSYYITAIKYSEYQNVPVRLELKNDNYSVVKNYSDEELEELNIESEYLLKLYDRIIVNKKQ